MKQSRASALLSKGEKMKNLILFALVLFVNACTNETKAEQSTEIHSAGSVVLTFDDGSVLDTIYENHYLFDAYGAKFTYFVSHYEDSMIDRLIEMQNKGHEIAHHTALHRDAVKYVDSNGIRGWLSDEVLRQLFKMREDGLFIDSFAYPFGSRNATTDSALKPYFKKIRWSGVSKFNYVEGYENDNYLYYSVTIDSYWLKESLFDEITNACKTGKDLVLIAHAISDNWPSAYYITPDNVNRILSHAYNNGCQFKTMREL